MNRVLKNLVWGFAGQFLILATSIVLPRFILVSFGSEINGVTSTITQIFTYIALLEAGIGNASLNRLYKYIAQKDRNGISETVATTKRYFRRVVPLYSLCVVALAIIYPLVVTSEIPQPTIRWIIIIQGVSGVVNFWSTNAYTQLLIADGRNYVSSNLNLMVKLFSTIMQILLILAGFDIIAVQLSLLLAYVLKAIIIHIYVRKVYPWLTKVKKTNMGLLEQRTSFLLHEVSGVVFQSTDVVLISIFCSMKDVSIYTIYNMVFVGLSGVFTILFKGIDFKLGTEFHRDTEKYMKLHDSYETLYSSFVFAVISAAYVVCLPFVRLYTEGISDANYVQSYLPLLFALVQLLSASRTVASKLISVSGRAKNTVANATVEMILNIIVSVVLINLIGMPGALLGTVVALFYRTNDMLIYANVKILGRKPKQAYKTLAINFSLFVLIVVAVDFFPLDIMNYGQFLLCGAATMVVMLILFFSVNLLINNLRDIFATYR